MTSPATPAPAADEQAVYAARLVAAYRHSPYAGPDADDYAESFVDAWDFFSAQPAAVARALAAAAEGRPRRTPAAEGRFAALQVLASLTSAR